MPEWPAQARLVQLFAARELGIDMDMASWRLRQLTLLLPDMGARSFLLTQPQQLPARTPCPDQCFRALHDLHAGAQVAAMKPALLADILRDTSAVAARCVGLRDVLPYANVSRLVAGQPAVLLQVLCPACLGVDFAASTVILRPGCLSIWLCVMHWPERAAAMGTGKEQR